MLNETFDGKTNSIYAGKTVRIISGVFKGEEYRLENWQTLVTGKSWKDNLNNPAVLEYICRTMDETTPPDNNVYYGKIAGLGHLIHASQIEAIDAVPHGH